MTAGKVRPVAETRRARRQKLDNSDYKSERQAGKFLVSLRYRKGVLQ
jgi:hypothetical protein